MKNLLLINFLNVTVSQSCPKVIHNMMLECWNKDRAKRPKFKEIRERIEQWIRSPELLEEIASVVTKTYESFVTDGYIPPFQVIMYPRMIWFQFQVQNY